MKVRALASISLTVVMVFVAVFTSRVTRAGAATTFVCGVSDGVPATLAQTERGDIPVIRWTSDYFSDSGWTPQTRCEAVSERFQTYNQNGTLEYLTTGVMNGMPVICTALEENGPCNDLLLTLKQDANPTQTLQELLNVRDHASGPINQSNSRLYINMSDYLQTAPVEAESSPDSSSNSSPDSSQTQQPSRVW